MEYQTFKIAHVFFNRLLPYFCSGFEEGQESHISQLEINHNYSSFIFLYSVLHIDRFAMNEMSLGSTITLFPLRLIYKKKQKNIKTCMSFLIKFNFTELNNNFHLKVPNCDIGVSNIRPVGQNWPSKDSHRSRRTALENVTEDINFRLLTDFFF